MSTTDIPVLSCPNHADLEEHTSIGFADEDESNRAARFFCEAFFYRSAGPDDDPMANANPTFKGYIIEQDRVRGERELILCDPAGGLRRTGSEPWAVSQSAGPPPGRNDAGSFTVGDNNSELGIGRHQCWLNNNALQDFSCPAPIPTPDPEPAAPKGTLLHTDLISL